MDLKLLGLNKFESEAYTTLVRIGKASASTISNLSKVPQSRIYDVLETLISEGLVKVSPEQPRQYIASDPEALKKILDEKMNSLKELGKSLENLEKSFKTSPAEVVSLTKGKHNFHRLVRELPKAKKYGYTVRYTVEYNPEWVRSEKTAPKNIDSRSLVRYDDETVENVRKWIRLGKTKYRKIPNEGIAMAITDDHNVLIGLVKSEVQLVIKDEPFAKLMKELFLNYYEHAEKIPKS